MTLCNRNLDGLMVRVGVIILLVSCLFVTTGTKALAADEQPTKVDAGPIEVFMDVIEDDDFLAIVPYQLSFSSNPSLPIDQTYIFSLRSSNSSTQLGAVLAEPAYDNGYGHGVVSFYLESGASLGENYIVRIAQNPAYYTSPVFWDFIINAGDYSTASDVEAAIKARVVDVAGDLEPEFEVSLLTKSEAGTTVLTTYGEIYFLEAIPGLQIMCPSLFQVELTTPEFTKRTWSTTFADTLKTRYSGTIIYDFMSGFAGLFNTETSPAMNFLSTILFLLVVGFSVWKCKASTLSAMMDGYAFLLLLMLIGWFSMIWAGFIAFISAVVGGAILFFKRA